MSHRSRDRCDEGPGSWPSGSTDGAKRGRGEGEGEEEEEFALPILNLPNYEPQIRVVDRRRDIFDPVRRQFVRLTPEEWVRQHFLEYLSRSCGYPVALMAVEKGFQFQQMARRADIVVHDRRGRPFLMVECKAPGIPISQSTFDQVSRYNRVVKARFLIVTNGLKHYCWTVEDASYRFLDGPPPFAAQEGSPMNDTDTDTSHELRS